MFEYTVQINIQHSTVPPRYLFNKNFAWKWHGRQYSSVLPNKATAKSCWTCSTFGYM